ncbi:MAG TPA: hypothetical protein VK638_58230 [Edaphobacter sp.]|nr:hypothetical protein [Edaphobacter sp.]
MTECQALILIGFIIVATIGALAMGFSEGKDHGYFDAAEDSLKTDVPKRWRVALINAKAAREKEMVD